MMLLERDIKDDEQQVGNGTTMARMNKMFVKTIEETEAEDEAGLSAQSR